MLLLRFLPPLSLTSPSISPSRRSSSSVSSPASAIPVNVSHLAARYRRDDGFCLGLSASPRSQEMTCPSRLPVYNIPSGAVKPSSWVVVSSARDVTPRRCLGWLGLGGASGWCCEGKRRGRGEPWRGSPKGGSLRRGTWSTGGGIT